MLTWLIFTGPVTIIITMTLCATLVAKFGMKNFNLTVLYTTGKTAKFNSTNQSYASIGSYFEPVPNENLPNP